MSIPVIIALNLGSASLFALIATVLMLIPNRLHRHPHPTATAASREKMLSRGG